MSDLRIQAMLPAAARLVCAVKDADKAEVATVLDTADKDALLVLLASMVPDDAPAAPVTPTLRTVFETAAEKLSVDIDQMLSTSRDRWVTNARMVAFYVGSTLGYSTPQMGRFAGRDHSTVVHAIARVRADGGLSTMAEAVSVALLEAS